MNPNTLEEILSRYYVDENGCHLFIGATSGKGYAEVKWKGKNYRVHRLAAYFYLGLDLDSEEQALHNDSVCKSKRCINKEHLYIGSNLDNVSDRIDKRTHCKNGHELTKENTFTRITKAGKLCKICEKARQLEKNRRYRLKLKRRKQSGTINEEL